MSDAGVNYHVEQQRLRMQIAQLKARIEQQTLEIMEMADRRKRHEDNIESSKAAIQEYEERLAGLIETHGKGE